MGLCLSEVVLLSNLPMGVGSGYKHKIHIKVWHIKVCHYVSSWASDLTPPNLSFPVYKMRTNITYVIEWFKNLEK